MDPIQEIVLIGSGNLATQLGIGLNERGYQVTQVYSRKLKRARKLAEKLKSEPIDRMEKLNRDAHLYLVCVSDDAIESVVDIMPNDIEGIIAHTSGFTSVDVLRSSQCGVFWPLQTITAKKAVQWNKVPIIIEGTDAITANALCKLANELTGKGRIMTGADRRTLHMAAVIASNYTNFMYVLAEEVLQEKNIDFKLLKPLIKEVARKSAKGNAWKNQTGPAKRGDQHVIHEHLEMLKNHPEIRDIYASLAESIGNYDD